MGQGGPLGTGQLTGSASPQLLVPANQMRAQVKLYASGTGGFYGGEHVTTTNGFPVPTTAENAIIETSKDAIYVVGSVTFYFAETSYD